MARTDLFRLWGSVVLVIVFTCTNAHAFEYKTLNNGTYAQWQLTTECLQSVFNVSDISRLDQAVPRAVGTKLTEYKACLANQGTSFHDPGTGLPWEYWVRDVNDYCKGAVVFGIGNDYNAYKNCLKDRGITPDANTVSKDYLNDVNSYCFSGPTEQAEVALNIINFVFLEAAGGIAKKAGSAVKTAYTIADTVKDLFETAQLVDNVVKSGGDMTPRQWVDDIFGNLIQVPEYALTDYNGYKKCLTERNVPGVEFVSVAKSSEKTVLRDWANLVSDYCRDYVVSGVLDFDLDNDTDWKATSLRQCLTERDYPIAGSKPGDFFPGMGYKGLEDFITDKALRSCEHVYPQSNTTYQTNAPELGQCLNTIGVSVATGMDLMNRDLWYYSDLDQYIRTECKARYNKAPASYSLGKDAVNYLNCIRATGLNPSASEMTAMQTQVYGHCKTSQVFGYANDYNGYWSCLELRETPFINDDTWKNDVKKHCNGAVTGGRAVSYNEYKTCLSQRKVPFVVDAAWSAEVRSYCSSSNMVVNKLSGYKTCLSQRSVDYVESYWRTDVKKYCDGSYYTGGRFADYSAYQRCFTDRGTTFINDSGWKSGVRSYCSSSNVQYNKLPGFKTCISQRSVSYDSAATTVWCGAVKNYCEAQWYPFGGKDVCYSERGCKL